MFLKINKSLIHAATRTLAVFAIAIVGTATSGWATEKPLFQFTGGNGSGPAGPLVFDGAGSLYGTTVGGGPGNLGVVFKLTPTLSGRWEEQVLHFFKGGSDGAFPTPGLVFDGQGNLYGTTKGGGGNAECYGGCGTVFKLAPNASGEWGESILCRFTNRLEAAYPAAGLIFDAQGNLYGTTGPGGGLGDRGTVFKLAPTSSGPWTETVLHAFDGVNGDGNSPLAPVVFDAAGNLYGTTYIGAEGGGIVFKLTPTLKGMWVESIIHTFGNGDGVGPTAGLVFDSQGNLYGTTVGGGSAAQGTVFELMPGASGTWTENILYSFQGGTDGAGPTATVILDAAGDLYGTTKFGGGNCNCGTVFKLAPSGTGTWTETVLTVFTSQASSGEPIGGLIFDASGNLYGTTFMNGNGNTASGQVFMVTP